MSSIEPSRYEDGRPMLLGGLRRHHAMRDPGATIAAQWEEFTRLGPLPGQQDAVAYGVVCGSDAAAGTFEYMCAAEVGSLEALPRELGRMRVPAQRYAVFTHRGQAASLRATWDAIWRDWLPRSGHHPANTPDFERYDAGYDPRTGAGEIEIWFPVAMDGQARWEHGAPARPTP